MRTYIVQERRKRERNNQEQLKVQEQVSNFMNDYCVYTYIEYNIYLHELTMHIQKRMRSEVAMSTLTRDIRLSMWESVKSERGRLAALQVQVRKEKSKLKRLQMDVDMANEARLRQERATHKQGTPTTTTSAFRNI